MKTNKWLVEINGSSYEITFAFRPKSKQQVMYVNGEPHILPSTTFWNPDMDYCFYICDYELHLVTSGQSCDLAVNGVFQTSKLEYKKDKMAPWGIIFISAFAFLFSAMIVLPIILFHTISVWIILAIPLTISAINVTYRLSRTSLLSSKQLMTKPIILIVLMLLYLFLMLLYQLP